MPRGFALVLVLWTMVLLSFIGTRIAASGRMEAQLAANIRGAAVVQAAADGAVQQAAFHLLDASPDRWRADGAEHVVRIGAASVTVRAESEDGRINPNLASSALLAALLRQVGADTRTADRVASAITEWRFPTSLAPSENPAMRPYRAAGLTYGPTGAPFRDLDELGAVLGMTPELLGRAAPHLSLHVGGDPDPAYAAPIVLQAIRSANGGRVPASSRAGRPSDLVRITAAATGPGGSRFTRQAVVLLNRTGLPLTAVLAWASVDAQ